MKDLIISAPYYSTHDYEIHSNIYESSMMAKYYWKQGYNVFYPHMNTAFFGGLLDEAVFLQACLERIAKADVVAFRPNWESSIGCRKEYSFANSLKKEVLFPCYADFMIRN